MFQKKTYSLLEFKELIKNITNTKKIYIFGAGTYGKMYGSYFDKNNITWEGFIDTNSSLVGEKLLNKDIFDLDNIKEDAIVIFSLSRMIHGESFDGLYKKLNEKGVQNSNILYFGDDLNLMDDIFRAIKDVENIIQRNIELKDIYKGKRCFIIGNGPSLKVEDLDRIGSEISMACNGIYKIFDKSLWRPTCFFAEDSLFLSQYIENDTMVEYLLNNSDYLFTTLRSDLYEKYFDKYEKLFYLYAYKTEFNDIDFSADLTTKIYSAATTIYTMLQVAVYMGITEIYLLGIDFTFKREVKIDGNQVLNEKIKDHANFIGENNGIYHTDVMLKGYGLAKEYCEKHGIKIYNATRGGQLEKFERVNFDDLF